MAHKPSLSIVATSMATIFRSSKRKRQNEDQPNQPVLTGVSSHVKTSQRNQGHLGHPGQLPETAAEAAGASRKL